MDLWYDKEALIYNQLKQMNAENKRFGGKVILGVLLVPMLLIVGVVFASFIMPAQAQSTPEVPSAQASYDLVKVKLCLAEKDLAMAKMHDALAGLGTEPARMDNWLAKSQQDCGFKSA